MDCHVRYCQRVNEIMFHVKHRKDENMKKYSELYNDIKKEIYGTFSKEDICGKIQENMKQDNKGDN